jgi:hypothetical protein
MGENITPTLRKDGKVLENNDFVEKDHIGKMVVHSTGSLYSPSVHIYGFKFFFFFFCIYMYLLS